MVMQHIANGKTDLFWRQFFRRHLVGSGWKVWVVVLVNERDPDVGIAQVFERAETDAKDDHMGMSVIASPLQSQIMWRRGALPAKKAGFSGCPLTACLRSSWNLTPADDHTSAARSPPGTLNPRFILPTVPATIGVSSAPRRRSYRGLDQVNLMDQAPQSLIVDTVGRTQAIKLRALRAQAR